MTPLQTYLSEMQLIYRTGQAVPETSYYGVLANLLNEVGRGLKPKVLCVINLRNRGAGIPDGGLFSAEQVQAEEGASFGEGQLPARGVLEVKGVNEAITDVAESEQVARYLERYRQVLVTNYRDFLLLSKGADGEVVPLERYTLSAEARGFWGANPQALAGLHEERFLAYLRRVLLNGARLADPKDVAWFLASYAREAKARLEHQDLPALQGVREALEEALGITFKGARGMQFFRSTLIQTLFYGVFSAWVLWSKEHPPTSRATFEWRTAAWTLKVPVIRALFERVATPTHLSRLGLTEVLDWTGSALNRIDRASFFERFNEGQAVQYFYEPFLEAFDPELRNQLGVWYTPPEIIEYMVARVDTVLRQDLGLPDGLADESVYVLDPCCGTGAYLVGVLNRIAQTLREKGDDALLASDLKRAVTGRVFGFELLPAPFVVAHLQLGLLLQNLGVPLSDAKGERASIYLTNALTGWKEHENQPMLSFPELGQERDAAEEVKQQKRILVVLGNPPYNGFADIAVEEERELSNSYRSTRRAPKPRGQGLNDLYVRFYRMAERQIAEQTGTGIVCFISNYSWLDGLSFTGMRERYLEVFDKIWIDNLHGDRLISERSPDGQASETIFAMRGSSSGIKVGTAIATLLVKNTETRASEGTVFYRDMEEARAAERRQALLDSLKVEDFNALYEQLSPELELGLPLKQGNVSSTYLTWPLLTDLFPQAFPGVKTSRDDFVIDIDKDALIARMKSYFDPQISHEEVSRECADALKRMGKLEGHEIRDKLRAKGFRPENIVRYLYRPFDLRWVYWEPEHNLLDRARDDYFPQVFPGNGWLEARQKQPKETFDRGYFTNVLADNFGNGLSSFFPMYIKQKASPQASLFSTEKPAIALPNLSKRARDYLNALAAPSPFLFHHTLALLHAPTYRLENTGALRQDWPRVALPDTKERLTASAKLGRMLAALLDPAEPVVGVSTGTPRPELAKLATITAVGSHTLDPSTGDLALSVGWGRGGGGNAVMPGRGKVVMRDYTPDERATLEAGAAAAGIPLEQLLEHLGKTTTDIYLNDKAYWRNIPQRVWDYSSGGYQVIKKWLSYREESVLGRALTAGEARELVGIARRIAGVLMLEAELDANYEAVKANAHPWLP